MLQAMVRAKAIRKHKSGEKGVHDIYSTWDDVDGPAAGNFAHEVAVGDLYVAFRETGKVARWSTRWTSDEYHGFAKECGVNPDAVVYLEGAGQTIFLEVDMGQMSYARLNAKVERYKKMAGRTSPFAVVFLFADNAHRGVTWKPRAEHFNEHIAKEHGRGKQFSVGCLSMLIEDPLGECIYSYKSRELFSVLELAR